MRTLLITNNQKTLVLEVLTDAIKNTQENVTIHDIKIIKGELQGAVESGLNINIPNVISLAQFKSLIDSIGLNLEIIDCNTFVTVPLVDNSADVFDFTGDKGGALDDGIVGEEYGYIFATENGIGNVVFTYTGNLPTGLSLSKGGVLSGELTEASEEFEFTIIATDSTSQVKSYVFTVEVEAAPSTEANILTYSIPTGATAVIDDEAFTISIEMPYGTSLAALTPVFTLSAGATASPASGVEDDFTSPVTVTVTAEDGETTQDWTVTVEIAAIIDKFLTFNLLDVDNTALDADVTGVIDDTNWIVNLTVPFGTNVAALVPSFTVTNDCVVEIGGSAGERGAAQVSGETANAFTSAVEYQVWEADFSNYTQYNVVVTITPGSAENDILTFVLAEETGTAVIDNTAKTVTIEVALGTDLATLTPTFTLSEGATASPESGVEVDFTTSPITYDVTAEDGTTTQVWNVTVTIAGE